MKACSVTILVALMCVTACSDSTPVLPVAPTRDSLPPAPGPAPTGQLFAFVSDNGDWVGAGKTQRFDTAADYFSAAALCAGNRVDVLMHGADGSQWYLLFAAPRGIPIRVGSYERAGTGTATALTSPQLAISGESRACNGTTGRFDVLEAVFGAGGRIERFHAAFDQRCAGSNAKLSGEILLIAPVFYNLTTGCL
jgi:hypothetical protein